MAKPKYTVPAHLLNCDVHVDSVPFERKASNPLVFELKSCTQKELAFLAEVHGYPLETEESVATPE